MASGADGKPRAVGGGGGGGGRGGVRSPREDKNAVFAGAPPSRPGAPSAALADVPLPAPSSEPSPDALHLLVLLDVSGSMGPHNDAPVRALNAAVALLKRQLADMALVAKKAGGAESSECLTLYLFAKDGCTNAPIWDTLPVQRVPAMDPRVYNPDGGTQLYDSIMGRLDRFRGAPQLRLIVITDGEDSESVRYGFGAAPTLGGKTSIAAAVGEFRRAHRARHGEAAMLDMDCHFIGRNDAEFAKMASLGFSVTRSAGTAAGVADAMAGAVPGMVKAVSSRQQLLDRIMAKRAAEAKLPASAPTPTPGSVPPTAPPPPPPPPSSSSWSSSTGTPGRPDSSHSAAPATPISHPEVLEQQRMRAVDAVPPVTGPAAATGAKT